MASLAFSAASTAFSGASVTDGLQIEALSNYISTDKTLLYEGEVELSKAAGENLRLIVMLNGTQIAELSEAQSEEFLDKFPDLFTEVQSSGVAGGSGSGIIAKYFSSLESVLKLGAWREGITFDPGLEAAFSGALMIKARADIELIKKFGPIWAGGAIGYKSYVIGELPSKILDENPDYGPASSLPIVLRAIVAVPLLKIEVEYDGNYLPEYHWLQENDKIYWNKHDHSVLTSYGYDGPPPTSEIPLLDTLLQYNTENNQATDTTEWRALHDKRKAGSDGQVVDYFEGADGSFKKRSPLTFTATAKLGVFHGALIYSASYNMPLFRIYVDELELFIGKWGMGVISSRTSEGATTFVPGVWVDIYEFNLKTMNEGVVKWSPLKLYFHKLNRSFLMGMKSTFHFDFAR